MKTESLSYGELLDLQAELKGAPSLHQQLALEAVNAAVELREQHQDRENLFQELEDERSRAEEAEEKANEYDE